MQPWEHMLDEFAIHPDPMPWWGVPPRDLRMSLADQYDAVVCVLYDEKGYLDVAGLRTQIEGAEHKLYKDVTFAPTPEGRAYWEANVKGRRRRPKGAPPVPSHSLAKRALARGPREVFDLSRVPWQWRRDYEELLH